MQQTACSTATLAKLLPKREFSIDCDLALQTGDTVLVSIDDAHLLSASLLLYMLPLLAMLGAVGLANLTLPAGVQAWLPEIALSSLLLMFRLIYRCQSMLLLYFCFKPKIVRKLASC